LAAAGKAACTERKPRTREPHNSIFPRQKKPRTIAGGESSRAIGVIFSIEAIDQSGQHCYDTREHFLTVANTIGGNETLSDRRIEAGSALECRAAGVIEKLGALATLTFTVSFGRIEKYGETRAVKLFNQLASVLGRRLVDIVQIFGDPGNEPEFDAIDI